MYLFEELNDSGGKNHLSYVGNIVKSGFSGPYLVVCLTVLGLWKHNPRLKQIFKIN